MATTFEALSAVNVNGHTEEKNGLTYLSWPFAWAEVCRRFPGATYDILRNEQGLPYVYDENTGYMVFTTVRIGDEEHTMWLPVMDSANNAMKSEPYKVKTKYKEIDVKAATMFDVNKTIMRCLVKNLAMFGLGLYIYAGEDLPEVLTAEAPADAPKTAKPLSKAELIEKLSSLAQIKGFSEKEICSLSKENVSEFGDMTKDQLEHCIAWVNKTQKLGA